MQELTRCILILLCLGVCAGEADETVDISSREACTESDESDAAVLLQNNHHFPPTQGLSRAPSAGRNKAVETSLSFIEVEKDGDGRPLKTSGSNSDISSSQAPDSNSNNNSSHHASKSNISSNNNNSNSSSDSSDSTAVGLMKILKTLWQRLHWLGGSFRKHALTDSSSWYAVLLGSGDGAVSSENEGSSSSSSSSSSSRGKLTDPASSEDNGSQGNETNYSESDVQRATAIVSPPHIGGQGFVLSLLAESAKQGQGVASASTYVLLPFAVVLAMLMVCFFATFQAIATNRETTAYATPPPKAAVGSFGKEASSPRISAYQRPGSQLHHPIQGSLVSLPGRPGPFLAGSTQGGRPSTATYNGPSDGNNSNNNNNSNSNNSNNNSNINNIPTAAGGTNSGQASARPSLSVGQSQRRTALASVQSIEANSPRNSTAVSGVGHGSIANKPWTVNSAAVLLDHSCTVGAPGASPSTTPSTSLGEQLPQLQSKQQLPQQRQHQQQQASHQQERSYSPPVYGSSRSMPLPAYSPAGSPSVQSLPYAAVMHPQSAVSLGHTQRVQQHQHQPRMQRANISGLTATSDDAPEGPTNLCPALVLPAREAHMLISMADLRTLMPGQVVNILGPLGTVWGRTTISTDGLSIHKCGYQGDALIADVKMRSSPKAGGEHPTVEILRPDGGLFATQRRRQSTTTSPVQSFEVRAANQGGPGAPLVILSGVSDDCCFSASDGFGRPLASASPNKSRFGTGDQNLEVRMNKGVDTALLLSTILSAIMLY